MRGIRDRLLGVFVKIPNRISFLGIVLILLCLGIASWRSLEAIYRLKQLNSGTLVTTPADLLQRRVQRSGEIQALQTMLPITFAVLAILILFVSAMDQKLLAKLKAEMRNREQLQEALITSEKLAAMGRMAASIAHEINNPLSSVTNALWLIRHSASPETTLRLDVVDEEMRRISRIVKQTLGFYRDKGTPEPVSLREVCSDVAELYNPMLRLKRGRLLMSVQPLQIVAKEGELRQVVANMYRNAVEAIEIDGSVTLRCKMFKGGALITIADNGCGVSEEFRRDMFKPFSTTKSDDDAGTGLGLWISQEIVTRHNGYIKVRSSSTESRHFTVFRIFLPDAQVIPSIFSRVAKV